MTSISKKARRDGRHHHGERLAFAHKAASTAAVTATEQARDLRLSKPVSRHLRSTGTGSEAGLGVGAITPADKPDPSSAELTELERQEARARAAAWILTAREEVLVARAADKRVAILEDELRSAREELALRENENHSLQTSLDLVAGENSRLSLAAVSQLDQFEQMATARDMAEAALDELAVTAKKADEGRDAEASGLKADLEAARAELELLCGLLQSKEHQIQELEQVLLKLIEDTDKLLKASATRDTALALAEEKVRLLTELSMQPETKTSLGQSQQKNEIFGSPPPSEGMERNATKATGKKASLEYSVLQRELANDAWLLAAAKSAVQ
jgi:hypothetical protein